MSFTFELKQYYRIAACLSLALGLTIALPGDAAATTRKATAQSAKQKAKAAPPKKTSAAKQKTKAKAPAPLLPDPVTELEIINGEAIALNNALAANSDDTQAQQKLGLLALRAARAAERALSRGDDNLFTAYRAQFTKHFAATRPDLEAMAGRGIGAAAYALGALDLHGMLGASDVERACAHFAAALDKGFSGAKFRHAQCIEERDPQRAQALMQEAADAGHVGAIERLGRACLEAKPPDVACAHARLERASSEGRLSATTLLGWMHAEGIGSKPDPARAARYYREAAEQGEPSARNNLGELYETGRGVAKDPAQAFDHYLLAALAGFPPAQFNLGRLFATGKGTAKNVDEARRWLGDAAKAGVTPAKQILDFLDQETAK